MYEIWSASTLDNDKWRLPYDVAQRVSNDNYYTEIDR